MAHTFTAEKRSRVAGMFARGYSLDLIAEWGIHHGWTRKDALTVVEDQGWALDWSGRLQSRYLDRMLAELAQTRRLIGDSDIEYMLAVGVDHELTEVRKLAAKAQRAVDDLRRGLLLQEERDAEIAQANRSLNAQCEAVKATDPAMIQHGTYVGQLSHRLNKIPYEACGCEEATPDGMREGVSEPA